uniref:Ribosomal protein S20 n=1 Tax=Sporolithon durum TaxID=48970 RepID=A0A141SCT2_9FLOR|nr:ribosomal protein S20 [Sporolithon durum]AMK96100.1 ribosomal protein S20 [Sporolithon durum]
MSNTLSSSKRVQITARNNLRNKIYKSSIKTKIKYLYIQLYNQDIQAVQSSLSDAYSKIDKAVKKGILHKNHGARKKSALHKLVKNLVSKSQF